MIGMHCMSDLILTKQTINLTCAVGLFSSPGLKCFCQASLFTLDRYCSFSKQGNYNDNDKCCFLAPSTFIDFPLSVRVFLGHDCEGGGDCVKTRTSTALSSSFLLSLEGKSMKREAVTGRKCMGNAENTFRKQERTGWDRGSSPGEHHLISIIGHFYMEKTYTLKKQKSRAIKYSKRMTVNTCAPQGCCLSIPGVHLNVFLITLKQINHQMYRSSHSKSAAVLSHQKNEFTA